MNNNILFIVQARMGSSRLKGKTLKKINDLTLLEILFNNIKKSNYFNKNIIVATTTNQEDNRICDICELHNIMFYRGSEEDVLSRFYHIIKNYNPNIVIRVTADNPLTSSEIIDMYIDKLKETEIDYIYDGKNKFPLGLSAEVFRANSFLQFYNSQLLNNTTKEHVTPIFTRNKNSTNFLYENTKDYSYIRLTIDTKSDFELVSKVIKMNKSITFTPKDIITFFDNNIDLLNINSHIKQITEGK